MSERRLSAVVERPDHYCGDDLVVLTLQNPHREWRNELAAFAKNVPNQNDGTKQLHELVNTVNRLSVPADSTGNRPTLLPFPAFSIRRESGNSCQRLYLSPLTYPLTT